MDLRVLGCPQHDLTISEKCLSVYMCVCDKNFVASVASNRQNFLKFFVTQTGADRHFPEIVKSCSGYPKSI